MIPVFDQFVIENIVDDSFSMQLCSSSELDPSAEPTVAGTLVSLVSVSVEFIHSELFVRFLHRIF